MSNVREEANAESIESISTLVDESGREENDCLVIQIGELLGERNTEEQLDYSRAFIFKVPVSLVRESHESYIPQLVGLGPYHFENPSVQSALSFKAVAARNLASSSPSQKAVAARNLASSSPSGYEALQQRFGEWDATVRKHYDGSLPYGRLTLATMMAVDSCFLSEWLSFFYFSTHHSNPDPNFASSISRRAVCEQDMLLHNITKDIIKLENQIPLELVKQVFYKRFPMESPAPVKEHFENVLRVFCYQLSPTLRTNEVNKKSHHEKLIRRSRHLLECLHTFALGFEAVPFAPSGSEFNIIAREVSGGTTFFLKGKESSTKDLPSATELNRAGVKFSATDKGLGYINFVKEDGVLEMPALVVEDMTEIVMRNLLAYEICCTRVQRKYITRYCHFMKALIQSNEDVKVLKTEGIIFNSLGGDDKVVSLWRSLTNSTRVPYIEGVERSVEEITEAYNSGKWRRLGNEYVDEYWSKPWIGISVIAATLLLLMTFLQVLALFCPSCLVVRGSRKL